MDDIFPVKSPDIMATDKCNMACKYCFEKDKGTSAMDIEKLLKYFSYNPARSSFPFGGEPLLVLDHYIKLVEEIKKSDLHDQLKKELLKKTKILITNGTLVKNNLEKIKKNGFELQISIDGPKSVHDNYRVYPNGKGTFDRIMEAVELCQKHKIPWSIHGVVARETLCRYKDIFKFYFETYLKYKGKEKAINFMKNNNFQIIFEDNYTDEDVDILIHQFHLIADYIYTRDYLNLKEKDTLFDKFFNKHGGVCAAGCSLMAIDTDFNIYPCHRLAAVPEREKYRLGNLFEPYNLQNKKLFNAFYEVGRRRKYMYSFLTDLNQFNDKENNRFFMWCPATHMQETGSPYNQPPKYNVMFTEVNRAIKEIIKAYRE